MMKFLCRTMGEKGNTGLPGVPGIGPPGISGLKGERGLPGLIVRLDKLKLISQCRNQDIFYICGDIILGT